MALENFPEAQDLLTRSGRVLSVYSQCAFAAIRMAVRPGGSPGGIQHSYPTLKSYLSACLIRCFKCAPVASVKWKFPILFQWVKPATSFSGPRPHSPRGTTRRNQIASYQVSANLLGVDDSMYWYSRSLACLFVFSVPALAGSPVIGIHNFFQVDGHVYRGAQPSESGFEYLAKIGVKTVLDLRESGDRASKEEQMVTALGLKYVNVAMSGLSPPTEAEISKILALLEDASSGAVFVHCMRGADRTGVVIAAYRIDHDHWNNDQALAEAKSDGMSFFQYPRKDYIRNFHPQAIGLNGAPKIGIPAGTAPGVTQLVPATAQ